MGYIETPFVVGVAIFLKLPSRKAIPYCFGMLVHLANARAQWDPRARHGGERCAAPLGHV